MILSGIIPTRFSVAYPPPSPSPFLHSTGSRRDGPFVVGQPPPPGPTGKRIGGTGPQRLLWSHRPL